MVSQWTLTRIIDHMSNLHIVRLLCHLLQQQQLTKAHQGEVEVIVKEIRIHVIDTVPMEAVVPMAAGVRILFYQFYCSNLHSEHFRVAFSGVFHYLLPVHGKPRTFQWDKCPLSVPNSWIQSNMALAIVGLCHVLKCRLQSVGLIIRNAIHSRIGSFMSHDICIIRPKKPRPCATITEGQNSYFSRIRPLTLMPLRTRIRRRRIY
jgi:hypothetical protein